MEKQSQANYEYSSSFPAILDALGCSLLVSTYQAGQLCSIGVHNEQLFVSSEPFRMAMGIAVASHEVSVSSGGMIWQLGRVGKHIANDIEPKGAYDAALLARSAHVTGNIHCHEMAYAGGRLWVVNTLFSCLATIDPSYSFVPRWTPPFISDCHVPGDRCHLNGMAVDREQVRYVTAIAETDTPNGWRAHKESSGVVIDVLTNEVVCRGLSMPHSPRLYANRLWVLNSGRGELLTIDPANGRTECVSTFPGYVRGLSFAGQFAFVALSKIRETAVFGGLPISSQKSDLKCGVGVLDLHSGKQVAAFQFKEGIEEMFAVEVLPQCRNASIRGINLQGDSKSKDSEIWLAPPLEKTSSQGASPRLRTLQDTVEAL